MDPDPGGIHKGTLITLIGILIMSLIIYLSATAEGNPFETEPAPSDGQTTDEDGYTWRSEGLILIMMAIIVSICLVFVMPIHIVISIFAILLIASLGFAHLLNIGTFDSRIAPEDVESWPVICVLVLAAAVIASTILLLKPIAQAWIRLLIAITLIFGALIFEYLYTHGIVGGMA